LNDSPSPEFHFAARSESVRANRLTAVDIDGQPVLLTRQADGLCAFNALCPHQLGNLARGFLNNGEIECPVHGWRFNIRTGRSVYPQDDGLRLRLYEVQEEHNRISVRLTPPNPPAGTAP
jgi:nitrite reductase/ring-hydroxylating ferredoxin subunit